jgi:hypothetical protein
MSVQALGLVSGLKILLFERTALRARYLSDQLCWRAFISSRIFSQQLVTSTMERAMSSAMSEDDIAGAATTREQWRVMRPESRGRCRMQKSPGGRRRGFSVVNCGRPAPRARGRRCSPDSNWTARARPASRWHCGTNRLLARGRSCGHGDARQP